MIVMSTATAILYKISDRWNLLTHCKLMHYGCDMTLNCNVQYLDGETPGASTSYKVRTLHHFHAAAVLYNFTTYLFPK